MIKQGCCFERPNFIMANRKSEKRMANSRHGQMVIIGAGSSHDAGLVSADTGRWSLVQEGGR